MSDHSKEAQRNLKGIRICDDIYLDVFRLLTPVKVGLELALVSDRIDALVDTHFKYRKWSLGKLVIYSDYIIKEKKNGSTKKILAFPQRPLPNSIVGFARFDFRVTNSASVIAFLKRIGRLLESNVFLKLHISDGVSNWNNFATSVWPLQNESAIINIHFQHPTDGLKYLRSILSPSILRDCTNLRMISLDFGNILQFPPCDSKRSSEGQAICKWLHKPRADGRPKVLKCPGGYSFPMDELKTSFLNATTSVSFIIHLFSSSVGPFESVNSQTREQLSQRIQNGYNHW